MKKKSTLGFYERVEKIGNKIPNPMVFFVWFAILVIVLSWVCTAARVTAVNPATGEVVVPYNLLSREGIVRMLTSMVSNFQTLSVLGPVLVCMFGVGICERSGLFRVVLQKVVESSKGSDLRVLLVFTFVAVLADAAGGTGYVVMPILGSALFASMGKPAVAGALCGYATVSGAFCANLLLTNMDVVNASFTVAAAQTLDPDFTASPAMTYFFSATSVFILTAASLFVTTRIVEPRLRNRPNVVVTERQIAELTPEENRGLRAALIAVLVYLAIILVMCIPSNGWLRDPETGGLVIAAAPLMQGLPFFIALLFFIPGVAYGFRSGHFKTSNDLVDAMGNAMVDMGPFVALCFVIAQFLAYFEWSNLATILAIKGAELLESSGLPPLAIMLLFILLCAFLNLFVGSASAKWGLMSSVFVPMFMLLGYHPAVTQMCFRVGDAASDPITPAYAYFAMLLSLCKKYDKDFGFGTLISNMLPYSLTFLACYMIQFIIWFVFQIPLGPGVSFML
ncbi:AbgT family transporter [Flintibacter sp. HCN-6482]|uniref:AbgT family transporter n=1 Tax=Flintibacter sp. HCN-6482 TaxID=3134672 RepID=UPI0030C4EF0B